MIKPYIDAEYYNNIFKPSKNARIQGTFNSVAQHIADFDAFRTRASEFVDRLLSGKIGELGGIDAMSDTYAKELIRKATASFVEHWFIKGYVMQDLNSTLNVGNLNASNVVSIKSFRDIAPMSALVNLQKTGMWEHKAIGINLSKELANAGIDASEVLTMTDALAIFEEKGMGLNFHIEGDFAGELTALPNKKRFIKIAQTPSHKISFEIIGGTQGFVKSEVQINRDASGDITSSEVFVYSPVVANNTPNFFTKLVGQDVVVYMEVEDNQTDTIFALSNAYPDAEGDYGVLGSLDNSNGLTEINKVSIIDHIASISLASIKKFNSPQDIANKVEGTIGYVENSTGDVDIILKTTNGVKVFKDFQSLKQYIDNQHTTQQAVIDQNKQKIAQNTNAIGGGMTELNKHEQEINILSTAIGGKQKEINAFFKNGRIGNKQGTFTSHNESGARQEPKVNEDLTDKEYVDAEVSKVDAKAIQNEKDILERVKRSEVKTATNSHNKLITENEEEQINDRLDAIEQAEELVDKVFNGTVKAKPNTDLTQIIDQNGDVFEYKAGKMLQVFIKNRTINTGKGYLMKVGDTTKTGFVIPKGGGASEHIDATLNTSGKLHLVGSNIGDYDIYRVIEKASAKGITNTYTKTEINTKLNKKADKTNMTTELGKKQDKAITITGITAKTVEKALLENNNMGKTNIHNIDTLNGKDVIVENGSSQNLDQITEKLITNKRVLKEIHSMIRFNNTQHIDFKAIQTGTKFEDSSLFEKYIFLEGQSKVGGTDGSTTKGSIPKISATQSDSQLRVSTTTGYTPANIGYNNVEAEGLSTLSNARFNSGDPKDQGYKTTSPGSQSGKYIKNGSISINTTGTMNGDTVKASGLKLLKVVYVAKKDITFGDML